MRRLALLCTAALLAAGAVPALATGPVAPVFTTQPVWFHDGGTKVGNLDAAAPGTDTLTFDATAPATSVSGGAGGGQLSDSVSEVVLGDYNDGSGPAFTGRFTGDLDTLDVDLYAASPKATSGSPLSVRAQLEVDGTPLYSDPAATAVSTVAGGQAAKIARFRFAGLYPAMQEAGLDVGPGVTHTVRLRTLVYFFGTETAWLFDTTEVPSGMVANAGTPAGSRTVLDLTPPPVQE